MSAQSQDMNGTQTHSECQLAEDYTARTNLHPVTRFLPLGHPSAGLLAALIACSLTMLYAFTRRWWRFARKVRRLAAEAGEKEIVLV